MGSRYGGLKQIDPMGKAGEWLLQYGLYDAAKVGFGKVVFLIRRDFEEEFRREIQGRCTESLTVEIAFQEVDDLPEGCQAIPGRTKPLGTGHAIWCARHAIDGPFAVVNADDFYGREAFRKMPHPLSLLSSSKTPVELGMVAYRLDKTLSEHGHVSRGICRLSETGELRSVSEHTRIVKSPMGPIDLSQPGYPVQLRNDDPVSMNLWGFTTAIFLHLEAAIRVFIKESGSDSSAELFIPFVVDSLIRSGQARVKVLHSESVWFGVTYPDDKAVVQAGIAGLIERGTYPHPLISRTQKSQLLINEPSVS